jgi:hypothetical protein
MTVAAKAPTDANDVPEEFEHPRGTLAIVIVFGLLFAHEYCGLMHHAMVGKLIVK